jgi:hypothetical protein
VSHGPADMPAVAYQSWLADVLIAVLLAH